MKILNYIFYKIFFMHSKGEDNSTAAGLAVMTTSAIFFANIFTIGAFLKKTNILPQFIHSKIQAILLMFLLVVINYFIFMYKKKYLNIKEKFDNESKHQKVIGSTIVYFYFFLSFILLLVLALYKPGYI